MATEIELKLQVLPEQINSLLSHPRLGHLPVKKYRLFNTYYDTPDFALKKRGVAVRLRRKGRDTWLMCVKTTVAGAGALASRGEWEVPTQPGVFDFSIIEDKQLRQFLEDSQPNLQEIFSTNFTRTAWLVEQDNEIIEVAFDQGKVSVLPHKNKASHPLCELELELIKGGTPQTLFSLAIEFSQNLNLRPEIVSKAARGYKLLEEGLELPAKAFISQINSALSPVEAFRRIALTCLNMLQKNESGAIQGECSEYVHQARVAIRRLRTALKIFSPALSLKFIEIYGPRWKALGCELGRTRDLDVFLAETLVPLGKVFPDNPEVLLLRQRAQALRDDSQLSIGTALRAQEYSRLLLAFSAALFWQDLPGIARSNQTGMTVKDFAVQRLEKLAGRIEKRAKQYCRGSVEQLHRLRIAFKELRYALEFFSPLFSGKRYLAYQAQLAGIQDLLGAFNDQMVAQELFAEMFPGEESAKSVPFFWGWIAGRIQLLPCILERELSRFIYAERPWS